MSIPFIAMYRIKLFCILKNLIQGFRVFLLCDNNYPRFFNKFLSSKTLIWRMQGVRGVILLSCLFLALVSCDAQKQTVPERVVEKTVVQCWDGSISESLEKCPPRLEVKEEPEVVESAVEEKLKDMGDFKLQYAITDDSAYQEFQQVLQESRLFETILDELNKELVLPTDIYVRLQECGDTNAVYIPEQKQIIMCYELMSYFALLFGPLVETEEEWDQAILHATFFTFFHEMGHALIDVFEIPVIGKEEDAVDGLSTLILSEAGEEGEYAALNGASWFFLEGVVKADVEDLAFWDEHSLDLQRFYNIACWIYGKNPEGHSYLVDEEILPIERAERCEAEYQQLYNSWDGLLAPYMKE